MSSVRPFRARIVRQSRAVEVVTPMADPPDGSIVDLLPGRIDPDAYTEFPSATYLYRQSGGGETFSGVVCEVRAEAFENGQVRGHESVRPDRVAALVRHFATSPDRPALVVLLHHAGPAFAETVGTAADEAPVVDFTGPDGLRQTVWCLPEGPAAEAFCGELGHAGLYIADGHHRVAASLDEWRAGGRSPGAGLLCVVHAIDALHLSAFHRRVTGPVDPAAMRALLASTCAVRDVGSQPTPVSGDVGVYAGGHWSAASFQSPKEGTVELDAARLHAQVLDPLVDAGRPARMVEFPHAHTPIDELTQRCDADGGGLFTLAPPSLDVLTTLADRGQVMPPKTTYFEPKPYAGIILRSLIDTLT